MSSLITKEDKKYLKRAVELAKEALEKGDQPFGSLLVSKAGEILFEDHNRVAAGDATQHPEFAIARWAANNLSPAQRADAKVYTSGEHCPMCAAAHGWVGLGRIVYASSSAQLAQWAKEMNWPPSPVKNLPIQEVINNVEVAGPVPEFAEEIKKLQQQAHEAK